MLKYLIFVLLTSSTSLALNGKLNNLPNPPTLYSKILSGAYNKLFYKRRLISIPELKTNNDGDRVCQPHRWYSTGPCQLCYCLSDQSLKCNPGTRTPTDIPLGGDQLYACEDISEDVVHLQIDPLRVMRHRMDSSGSSEEDRGLSISRSKADKKEPCTDDDEDKKKDSSGKNTKNKAKSNNINMKIKHDMEIKENYNIDFDLPDSIMNLIQKGMRKSMLTVKPGNDCVPGTQYLEDSLCFCMNNGKLLCRKGPATPNAETHS